jgi:hypothetical protein
MSTELETLVEQLDELLSEPIVDAEDALEVAIVAGLCARIGGEAAAPKLVDAVTWRDGDGRELLEELWREVDVDALIEEIDGVSTGGASDEEVEEAVFDFDDLVAAAIWCNRPEVVRPGAKKVAAILRQLPDPFAPIADLAGPIAKLRAVADHLDLYDYLFALSDAAVWQNP